MSKIDEIIAQARDSITVQRVYGEPYEKNGVTVIPAAAVRGGAGGGEGDSGENQPSGSGGGFGVMARPVGAYTIRGDEVTWVPAADTTRVIVLAEVVAIIALLVVRSILRRRRRTA
jgi:uncharacterized spore protein YtfJ